jgi:hypothetical protein
VGYDVSFLVVWWSTIALAIINTPAISFSIAEIRGFLSMTRFMENIIAVFLTRTGPLKG